LTEDNKKLEDTKINKKDKELREQTCNGTNNQQEWLADSK